MSWLPVPTPVVANVIGRFAPTRSLTDVKPVFGWVMSTKSSCEMPVTTS